MHGAAQTAKAAPSSAPDPRRRAEPFREREQAEKREAEEDDDEARDRLHAGRVQGDGVAEQPGAGAEGDEQDGESRDEREAREEDALGRPRLAEPAGLDGRDG